MPLEDSGIFVLLFSCFLALISYQTCYKSAVVTIFGVSYVAMGRLLGQFWLERDRKGAQDLHNPMMGVAHPQPCNLGSRSKGGEV